MKHFLFGTGLFLLISSGVLVAQTTDAPVVEPRNTASLEARIDAGGDYLLLDVRTPAEFAAGHIPTAENIDYRELRVALADEDRDREIIVYCRSGSRSAAAASTLRDMGFTDIVDYGGIMHWRGEVTTE